MTEYIITEEQKKRNCPYCIKEVTLICDCTPDVKKLINCSVDIRSRPYSCVDVMGEIEQARQNEREKVLHGFDILIKARSWEAIESFVAELRQVKE
jgi:hypothetical protein